MGQYKPTHKTKHNQTVRNESVLNDTHSFALENRCTLARTVGSNPTPSAILLRAPRLAGFAPHQKRSRMASEALAFASPLRRSKVSEGGLNWCISLPLGEPQGRRETLRWSYI